jgi:hypothetical protein
MLKQEGRIGENAVDTGGLQPELYPKTNKSAPCVFEASGKLSPNSWGVAPPANAGVEWQ